MAVTPLHSDRPGEHFETAAPGEITAPPWFWLDPIAECFVRSINRFPFYVLWLSAGPRFTILSSKDDDFIGAPSLAGFQSLKW
jgi:hypothetical protein